VFGDSYPNVIKPEAKINGKQHPFIKLALLPLKDLAEKHLDQKK